MTHNIEKDGYEYLVSKLAEKNNVRKPNMSTDIPHIITTEQKLIQGFFYKIKDKLAVVPEPNPIIIYFSNAQGFLHEILKMREELFALLLTDTYNLGDTLNKMFALYGCSVNFTSSLFDAMEAFINSKIPMDLKIPNPKRRGEFMNKYKILKHCTFEDKIKLVLPREDVMNKNFVKSQSHKYETIKKFKRLRDNITHTKSDIKYDVQYYSHLYTEALDFDYKTTLEHVKDFINFFEPDLIEICSCGRLDWWEDGYVESEKSLNR